MKSSKSSSQKRWRPPKGYVAIQTYVPREAYEALQSIRKYHDRSLRYELRRIVLEAVTKWANKQD